MRPNRSLLIGITASAGILALILDSQTALTGAAEGIDLCVRTVIPALFPFFLLSMLLTGSVLGTELSFMNPVGKLVGIPKGSEPILLAGLLGGYPVGAQCVGQAYASGQLNKADARRMLGFCSNAGPSFIFGMTSFLFENKAVPFTLWTIHIISALITGFLLPGGSSVEIIRPTKAQIEIGQALQKSLTVTATVCGWVVIFRIILSFLKRWFFWFLPPTFQIILTGILELTNGYVGLNAISNDHLRFILASLFLSFGGICVVLQTASVTSQAGLDMGYYFPGKLIQTFFNVLISSIAAGFLFGDGNSENYPMLILIPIAVFIAVQIKKRKNSSSIPAPSVV